jgi:phosphatidylinositol 4-kinase
MFDVSSFLLRWMFLSNLCRDVADIQTLPVQPYFYHPHSPQPPSENHWKEQCLRGILSYPPGTQRTLVLDALRYELVQQFEHQLLCDEDCIARFKAYTSNQHKSSVHEQPIIEDESDPFLDADLQIVQEFEQATTNKEPQTARIRRNRHPDEEHRSSLIIDDHSTVLEDTVDESLNATSVTPERIKEEEEQPPPSIEEIQLARRNLNLVRNYLPQLVSAVLKSPPAFDGQLSDAVAKLREVILAKCSSDPSAGIELCWLLEAEVGRAWKTLFEHRQQTGRRLIIVLPAERAAVLAKIGSEKSAAFHLLQDAEQATAYGFTDDIPGYEDSQHMETHTRHLHQHFLHEIKSSCGAQNIASRHSTRLPLSLSLRRCSHFGDTMHFIDRLTQISSDLRMVPEDQRRDYLHSHLYELNRRLRRRMVTRGDVSLDVEDNRSPYDWPQIDDMSADMIQYSVHLPLRPQIPEWPNGVIDPLKLAKIGQCDPANGAHEVVRAVNILVQESKILASRERCPFVVHLEVVDTGLNGNDARLYSSGAFGLGSTVGEALSMSNVAGATSAAAAASRQIEGNRPFGIPLELLKQADHIDQRRNNLLGVGSHLMPPKIEDNAMNKNLPRGGWQHYGHHHGYDGFDVGGSFLHADPFDAVRQFEYEQLHNQLHNSQQVIPTPVTPSLPQTESQMSVGAELLDKVFGTPWAEKCNIIRNSSPYGHVKGWRLASFILKAGEDIRREAFVMQIITKLQKWFQEEIPFEHRPFMRPYSIMCVGGDAGLLECLSDVKSIDEVKKRTDEFVSLREYFERAYGKPRPKQYGQVPGGLRVPITTHPDAFVDQGPVSFETAQDNFLRSLVGYSLVCYILQVKDRHNANILIDRMGHIMHIDFGFVLGDTPKMGKVPIFSERAPFKLSAEFWEVLGGWDFNNGGLGVNFCKMFELAFACAASHVDEIAALTEATVLLLDNNPRAARAIANGVRSRLRMRGPHGSREQKMFIMDLVNAALTSWGTSTYDWLQRSMNGYL